MLHFIVTKDLYEKKSQLFIVEFADYKRDVT